MPAPDPAGVAWRMSSFSGGNSGGADCVEAALLPGGEVAVRDTKDRTLPRTATAPPCDASSWPPSAQASSKPDRTTPTRPSI